MKIQYALSILLIVTAFAVAAYLYEMLPDPMPSHWNAAGEVDSYMEKTQGVFLFPVIAVFLFGLFLLIPKIDPLKKNIAKFRSYYDWFILLMVAFFVYLYFAILIWALGYHFNMSIAIFPPIAVLFYFVGILCENSKRNWFIGIRTPWTLSSDVVWDKTNRLGGKLFKVLSIVFLLLIFVPMQAVWLLVAVIVLAMLYLVLYSYLEFQKEAGKR